MTPENFCYWLQGHAELGGAPPSAEQWQSIREHLATVFKKVTPPVAFGGLRSSDFQMGQQALATQGEMNRRLQISLANQAAQAQHQSQQGYQGPTSLNLC